MYWKKHNKIFDPKEHSLIANCFTHAQSPQALVCTDFVRIYFSTRSLDANNKYLSHVAYVDFEKDLKTIKSVNTNNVISLGGLGAFDEHGIFPISPVKVDDKIYAYTTGWSRRTSVSVETGIGLAISIDGGNTFQRYGEGPLLSASLNEPFLVGDAFVRKYEQMFHMWYIFGKSWRRQGVDTEPERVYKIGHAVSYDGINWKRGEGIQIIPDRLGDDESQALPTVHKIAEHYHMFFGYRESFDFRHTKGRGYKIGHAISRDLETWVRLDDSLVIEGGEGEWDSDMQCYPHIFEYSEKIFMLYNGNNFGRDGFGLAELIV